MSRPAMPQMPHIQHSYARPATLLAPEVRAGPIRLMGDEPARADHLARCATRRRTSSASSAPSRRRTAPAGALGRRRRRLDDGTLEILRAARGRACRSSTSSRARQPELQARCATASRGRPRRAPSTAALAAACDWREYTHVDEARRRHRAAARLLRELARALRGRPAARDRRRRPRWSPRATAVMRRIPIPPHPRPRRAQAATRGSASRRSAASRSGSAGTRSTRPTRACAASRPGASRHRGSIHHRPLGSADGTLRGRARHGECAYIAHFTPDLGGPARVQDRPPPAGRAVRARLLLRLRPGGGPARRAGPGPRVPPVRTQGVAPTAVARCVPRQGERHEHRDRRAGLRRAAAGGGVRGGGGGRRSASTSTAAKVARPARGRSLHRGHPGRAPAAVARALHHATTRFVELHECRGDPDLRPDAADRATASPTSARCSAPRGRSAAWSARGQTIVLESTTFPGTTREYLVPLLEESGLRAGEDFALAFSPERVDPGRTDYTIRTTPKVVGGLTERLHGARRGRLRARLRPRRAGLHARGRRALQAAGEHLPLGQHRARQRDGDARRPDGDRHLGGHRRGVDQAVRLHALRARARAWAATACPVDPFYLTWKAREYDIATEFIELAGKVNQQMPYFCLEKIERALNDAGKPVRGSRILVARRVLQAGRGRHPRVAGAEDHRAAAGPRRRRSATTIPTCPSCRRSALSTPSWTTGSRASTWR